MSTSIRNRLPGTIEKIVSDKVVSELGIRTAAGDVTSIIATGSGVNLYVDNNELAAMRRLSFATFAFAFRCMYLKVKRQPNHENAIICGNRELLNYGINTGRN
jgi:molybdopterin-binding protein